LSFLPYPIVLSNQKTMAEGGSDNGLPGKAIAPEQKPDDDDYARRLAMLAVSSDSNLTVVGSRSVTSVPDPIVTEEDLGLWSSNLGKFPKPGKFFFPIVTKSIVSVPIVKRPIVIPTIVITQHFHTELLDRTGKSAIVKPLITPNCLTFAETVKRTYLVAKKANRQLDAKKTSTFFPVVSKWGLEPIKLIILICL
jgi:hypothetical protein